MTDHNSEEEERVVLRFPAERLDAPSSESDQSTSADSAAEGEETAEAAEPKPVDEPTKTEPGSALVRAEKRLPILPAWAKDPDEFRAAARWAMSYTSHTAAFH